jgi:hypothetical protein
MVMMINENHEMISTKLQTAHLMYVVHHVGAVTSIQRRNIQCEGEQGFAHTQRGVEGFKSD